MNKKFLFLGLMVLSFFLPNKVEALTAAEVNNRATDCPNIELASANPNGNLDKVACYNNYEEAKNVMNGTDNDNLVILEGRKIIDAKYALVDYDQGTSLGYTNIYADKHVSSVITYIRGGSNDDAVFLETDYATGRIKIKVGGVTGWITKYEVESSKTNPLYDIVPISWTTSPAYYEITASEIKHHLPVNVYNTKGKNIITFGQKPEGINPGNYFSYDGNYFYTNLKTMIIDYRNGNNQNAINRDKPYYNYYLYLSFRTKTNYNADNINQYLSSRISNQSSKLLNTGAAFIDSQNNYGVNALLMLAIGINESAFGNSNIAQTKNNLFGLNAVDATPGESANYYPNVETCISDYAYVWLDYGYVQPGDYRFRGANLGNKKQGLNLKYASDPYWGEKAAQYYYELDKFYNFQDYNSYQIAVLNNDYNNTVYPKKTPGGLNVSSSFYQYKQKNSAVVVLEEVTGPSINGNTIWYKIMSDPTLDNDLEYIGDSKSNPRITYNWDKNVVYVPAAYFHKLNSEYRPPNPNPDPSNKAVVNIVNEAGYNYGNGVISKIKPDTPAAEIINKLTSTGGKVNITDAGGNNVTSGTIGTGYKVNITSGNTESLVIIIYGDNDGDGKITAVDYVRIKSHIMGSSTLSNAYLTASDVNNDNSVSAVDYVNIKNYIMGNANVINN